MLEKISVGTQRMTIPGRLPEGLMTTVPRIDRQLGRDLRSTSKLIAVIYLMKDDTTYEMFKFTGNQEFTFDVDVSALPCGFNGALYFVSMDADGGLKKYSGNKAGAKYGTGYCDAQCPRDLKFINGEVLKFYNTV